jgi:DNA-binding SARP family transcriptional activator
MDVRLLGPVEVWRSGRELPLRRRQQRLILGILALEANHVVAYDRLIYLLWGERPPARARDAVQTRVSELRSILSGPADGLAERDGSPFVRQGDGYMLRSPTAGVDLHEFRHLVSEAQVAASDAASRVLLRQALGLWRGPALGGSPVSEPMAALCHGLDVTRLTALEQLFDIELRLGNHDAVVDQIASVFAVNPERERLAGLTLLALRRAGRNAEAIVTYDRWRRWLADALGIDPSQEIQQTYLSILRGGVPLEADAGSVRTTVETVVESNTVPRTLPPDISDFTGRGAEIAQIVGALDRDGGERPVVVALFGRAGVGKTALTVHVAHRVREAFPDGQLYADLRGLGDEGPARSSDVLGRLLVALGVDGRAAPRLLDERIDLYRALLADKRVLVVLDNAATDEQIAPLIPGGAGCAVLVNGRARLGVTFGALAFALDVLPPVQAVELLSSIAGSARVAAESRAALDLSAACGYLPLALRVAGAKLAAKPHWSVRKLVGMLQDDRGKLDQFVYGQLDVRTSIALSYADLAPQVQRLLKRLGNMELPEVSVFAAAALMDTVPEQVEVLLERLFDAQLIDFAEYDPTGLPRYRLHDLVRLFATERALIEDPPADLAAARGRVFGAWLRAGEAIHQHIYGGVYKNIDGDTPRYEIDSGLAAVLASEPLRWFETERKNLVATVLRAAKEGRAAAAWELASLVTPLFQIRRHLDDWWAVLACAMTAARQAGDLRGQAAMQYRMGSVRADSTEFDTAWRDYQDAARIFGQLDDRHGQACANAFTAMIERLRGENDTAEQRYHRTLPILRDSGDRGAQAWVERCLGQICAGRGAVAAASEHYERAMQIYRATGGRQGQAQTLFWHAMLHVQQSRYDEALAGFEEALNISRRLLDPGGEAQCLRGLGLYYQHTGEPDKADATLTEALRLVHQPHPTWMEVQVQETIASVQATATAIR